MDALNREIGVIMTELKHLRADVDQASDARKAQYARMEAIERKIDKLADVLERTIPRIEKGEEAANQLERISTMGRGYLFGVGVASAFGGGGLVMAFHDKVTAFFKGI